MTGATFACGTCGAALVFAGVRTATCPFCASPNVLPRKPDEAAVEPAFAIAFAGDAVVARETLHGWLGTRSIFTDRALSHARIEDLRAVYVPAYLYSAVARTTYTAMIGEHYTETETYQVTVKDESPGIPLFHDERRTKQEARQRAVTRIEEYLLRGRHAGYVSDVLVSASVGLAHHELARLAPFDLGELRRYAPALVSGFTQEEFSRDPGACRQASRAQAEQQMRERLDRFLPGDSHLGIDHATHMQWESLDPLLVPVWVFAVRYRDDRPPLRVLINGQTHAVVGRPPLVWWKVLIPIAVAVALALALWWGLR